MKKVMRFLATVGNIGYFPYAPGTIGTLVAFIVYLLLPITIVEHNYFWVLPVIMVFPSVFITGKAEQEMEKDDKRIVLDEFVGYFFAVLFLHRSFIVGVFAFILFRFFDIVKPEPVDSLQRMKNGWGIMADDVMSGIYANLCLQIIYFLVIAK
jgi:phosphatidylglycerophosphatase A